MKSPCEIVVRYFLPACRSLIAKSLIEDHGFTQAAAAKKLGTTQAAISFYLSSKRGKTYIKELENNTRTTEIIDNVVKGLTAGSDDPTHVMLTMCHLCTSLRDSDLICTIHKNHAQLPDNCDACAMART